MSQTNHSVKKSKSSDLSRDMRLQILTLFNVSKWSKSKIAQTLKVTYNQVRHTIDAGHPTPSKKSGRKPILSAEQIDELEFYICSSRETRQMPYYKLADGKGPPHSMFVNVD